MKSPCIVHSMYKICKDLYYCRGFKKINDFITSEFRTRYLTMSTKPRYKVFATRNDYPKVGIDMLKASCDVEEWDSSKGNIPKDELHKRISGAHGIFVQVADTIDDELLDAAGPQLKVIGTMSVGLDHINVPAVQKRGIRIGFTPDVLTEAVAELCIGLLLATSRRFFESHNKILRGEWTGWSPLWMCGPGLEGSTVGIVGFGRIGQSVARKLVAFKTGKILYTSRTLKKEGDEIGAEKVVFEELLKQSDFVIVTTALTPETNLMFNAKAFDLMQPTAVFVNVSRGGVVDQNALYDALSRNKIRAAGLDVMTPEPLPRDHDLLKLENCVLLPHIGSATYLARLTMSQLTATNILTALNDDPMPAEVK